MKQQKNERNKNREREREKKREREEKREREREKRERERREVVRVRARGVQLFMQFVIIITSNMYSKVVIKTDHIYSRDALSNLSSPVHIRGNAFAGKDWESVSHVDSIDGP